MKDVSAIDIYLGNRIRERRRALRISQTRLGETVDVSYQQIQRYEKGTDRISAAQLFSVSHALNIATSYFYDGLTEHLFGSLGFAETAQADYDAEPVEAAQGKALNDAFRKITSPDKRKIILELAAMLAKDEGSKPG